MSHTQTLTRLSCCCIALALVSAGARAQEPASGKADDLREIRNLLGRIEQRLGNQQTATDLLMDIVRRDPRYAYEAYVFVFEALAHSQKLYGRGVAKGNIAKATIDRIDMRILTAGRTYTGEIGKASVADLSFAPMLAMLDPNRPQGDDYRRVYGSLSAGPFTQRGSDGTSFSIDLIAAEDIGLYPDRFALDDLLFLTEVGNTGGKPPTPAQLGMLVDKIGGLYEGMRMGRLELKGLRSGGVHEAM